MTKTIGPCLAMPSSATLTGLAPMHGLQLRLASEQQVLQSFHNNAVEWGRSVPTLADYIVSEQRLFETEFAKKHARVFILVPETASLDTMDFLAQCELYFRQALIGAAQGDMELVNIASVAGVYVPPQHRGVGYGAKLMAAVRSVLEHFNVPYSTLYSDIGDTFYAKHGWQSCFKEEWRASSLPLKEGSLLSLEQYAQAALDADPVLKAYRLVPITEQSLPSVIDRDVAWIKASLSTRSHILTLVPTAENVLWHWSRPIYDYCGSHGSILQGILLSPKLEPGLTADSPDSCPFYAIWKLECRKKRLMVLRFSLSPFCEPGLAPLLELQQHIASYYDLDQVELWNPFPERVSLLHQESAVAQQLARQGFACNRHKLSLSCLYQAPGSARIDCWTLNEALFWC